VRRSDLDIANDPGVFGQVSLVVSGLHTRMSIWEWGNMSPEGKLLPELWDARCITWHSAGMLWQGFQHATLDERKGSSVYFQEWRIELLSAAPPADEIKSPFFARNSNL